MPGSYKSVIYTLRPAKAVERKMLCEAFRRLARFAPLDTYRYLGFGSVFFSDFLLFHRALGLTRMVNIESEVKDIRRFRFNRPFGSIKFMFEKSSEALPKLKWNQRSIVWLDYDSPLSQDVLADLETVCSNARSGSVLVVTLDSDFKENPGDPERAVKKLDWLKQTFGTRLPQEVSYKGQRRSVDGSLLGEEGGLARIYARMALDTMVETTRHRSAGLPDDRKVIFQQLFDFEYRDTARMVTVGGLLYEARERSQAKACAFEELAFVVSDGSPHMLNVPILTHREARYLDRHMPITKGAAVRRTGLSMEMVREYEQIYRWFPSFAETEL
ncbi:MAG: hypothetical protein M3P26_05830 [Gemmatimonadota bacterium]|nr:hypothetical protein [Gemmatimonadota bacterium]